MVDEDRIRRFWRVLASEPTDANCERCLAQLDRYVAAQLAGEAYAHDLEWVADHLDGCPDCATAYALLYDAAGADPPPVIPEPDLSFLQEGASPPAALANALHIAGDRVVLQLSAAVRAFLEQAAPPPAAALARSGGDERYGQRLLSLTPDQLPGLPLSLTAFRDAEAPGQALVEVVVAPPGQSWPDLGGKTVTLAWEAETRTAVTDDWGTAVFPGVPLPALDSLRLQVDGLSGPA